jgi:hypothetical protein
MASEYDLVTLDEVRAGLRIEDTGGDSPDEEPVWLELLITAASRAILAYLKSGTETFVDTGGLPIPDEVPAQVKAATIMLVGYIYREPDGDEAKAFAHGTLPFPVTAMIYQMRDPALA